MSHAEGLNRIFPKQLNLKAAGQYEFQVKIVPRSRLNHYLKGWINGTCPGLGCNDDWIVPWVNPKWGFIKGGRDNYLWHELLQDANIIVSRTDNDWQYKSPESLKGRVFGGMRGHRYVGIDDLVEAGEVKRIDGNRERDNLAKVIHQRIDATLLPESTVNYLLIHDESINARIKDLRISEEKHQSYMRYLMLPELRSDLLRVISTVRINSLLWSTE